MTTTVLDIQRYKDEGRRFAMLTAYDYTTARLLDAAGIPVLLVGDSLGMVMLGHPNTLPVTMDDMLHHAKAAARGAKNALLVGDMPFLSYQGAIDDAVLNAGRFLQEGGMHAVKLEGGGRVAEVVARLTASGIPVMAHIGLTPQSVHQMGGFKVQGKTAEASARLQEEAVRLQDAGAFSIVLEGVPAEVGAAITRKLRIPTIGIGAGPDCDAQVLVVHDMLGMSDGRTPRFVKKYANLGEEIVRAARAYAEEVGEGTFPTAEHSYGAAAPSNNGHARKEALEEVKYGG